VKIGVMELKTLYRAHKFGWYEYECLATCKRLKSKELATVDARGAIKLTVLGLNALVESKKLLAGWGWPVNHIEPTASVRGVMKMAQGKRHWQDGERQSRRDHQEGRHTPSLHPAEVVRDQERDVAPRPE